VGGLNLNPAQVGSLTNRPDFRARLARLPPELQERALSRLWTLTVRPKLSKGLADSEVEQSKQQFIRGVLRQAMPAPLERGQAPAPSAAMPGAPGSRVPLGTRAKEFGAETGKDVAALAGQFLAGAGTGVANIMRAPSYLGLINEPGKPWEWWEKEAEFFRKQSEERAAKHPILSGFSEVSGQIAPGAALAKAMPAIPTGPGAGVLKTAAAQLPKTAALAAPFAATPGELAGTTGAFAVLGAAGESVPALRRLVRRVLGKPLPGAPAAGAPVGAPAAAGVAAKTPEEVSKLVSTFKSPSGSDELNNEISQSLFGKPAITPDGRFNLSAEELLKLGKVRKQVLSFRGATVKEAAKTAKEAEKAAAAAKASVAKLDEKATKMAQAEVQRRASNELTKYAKAVPKGTRSLDAIEDIKKGMTADEAVKKHHAAQPTTTASTAETVAQVSGESPQVGKAVSATQAVAQEAAPPVTRMTYEKAAELIRSDEVIRNAVAEHMKLNPGKKAPQALRDVLRDRGMNVELAAAAPKARAAKAAAPPRSVAEIDNELAGLEQEAGAGRVSAEDYIDRKRKLLIEKAKATGETEVAKKLRQEQAAEGMAGKRKAALRTEALTEQEAQLGGGKRTKVPD